MVKTVKGKVARELAVEGTAKLAARSKPSDQHEKPDLTIEEATVASPRQTRHRIEPFFDFEDDTIPGKHDKSEHYKAPAAKKSAKNRKAADTGAKSSDKARGEKVTTRDVVADTKNVEPLESRVVADDVVKQKRSKADGTKSKSILGSSSETAQISDNHSKAGAAKLLKSAKTMPDEGINVKKSGDHQVATMSDGETTTKKPKCGIAEEKRDKTVRKTRSDMVANPTERSAIVRPRDNLPKKTHAATKTKYSDLPNERQDRAKNSKKIETTTLSANNQKRSREAKNTRHDPVKNRDLSAHVPEKPNEASGTDGLSVDNKNKQEDTNNTINHSHRQLKTTQRDQNNVTTASAIPARKTTDTAAVLIQPKDAMDQGPFEHLASLTDKVKVPTDIQVSQSRDEANIKAAPDQDVVADNSKEASGHEAAKVKPTRKKKAKANTSDVPDQAADQPVDLVKLTTNAERNSVSESTKGKKRKASAHINAEAIKSDVLDPLVELSSAASSKKAKKSRKSIGQTLGGIATAVGNSLGIGGRAGGEESADLESPEKSNNTDANVPEHTSVEATSSILHNDHDDRISNSDDDHDDEELNDQTAALLAGFESDGDDMHTLSDAGFKPGQKIPVLPNAKAVSKKLKGIEPSEQDPPGVVYVGRIPHGFYEHEMRSYFSQFGDIGHLRLSRSRKTGASKHYAFIEFKSADVAKIVADTMDTYLMFGHVLKCKLVAPGDVHDDMWKGSGKRFKKVPWNKIEGRKLEAPVGRDVWDKRVEDEKERRSIKAEKTKKILGYSFEAPLKGVEEVAQRTGRDLIVEDVAQEKSLITADTLLGAESIVSEEATRKRIRSGKKTTATVKRSVKRVIEDESEAQELKVKKARKNKISLST